MGEIRWNLWVRQIAGYLVADEIWQTRNTKSNHGRSAGQGFSGRLRRVVLSRWNHDNIGCVVRVNAALIIEVAKPMSRETA